jgi:hypothetical protein
MTDIKSMQRHTHVECIDSGLQMPGAALDHRWLEAGQPGGPRLHGSKRDY